MALRLGSRRDVTRDIDVAYDEHAVTATGAEQEAAGVKAVMVSLRRALSMGPFRTAASLVRLNQRKGFDCPGCAWQGGTGRDRRPGGATRVLAVPAGPADPSDDAAPGRRPLPAPAGTTPTA